MTFSFVIPFWNERETLGPLMDRLTKLIKANNWRAEVILVDDGSTDGYAQILRPYLERGDPPCKLIRLRRNFGQTAAMQAGFEACKGEVVVSLDADLQNPPEEVPKLIAKIQEGFDVVSGWRRPRRDPFLSRVLPSLVANFLIRRTTRVPLHDFGCTLKAYRLNILHEFRLYGEMHRFIPVYASWQGAKIAEVEVTHEPRKSGHSKYGMIRIFKVLLDLVTIKFLGDFSTKPMYFFGGPGLILLALGFVATVVTAVQKFCYGTWVHRNPMLLLAVFFSIMGVQLFLIGLLAEISIRNYYESQGKKTFSIMEVKGCGLEA
jgi:glycosyltransferase involved in cell wall biosynthesis